MKHFSFLLLIILLGNLLGCKNPASKSAVSVKENTKQADTLLLSGKRLLVEWGENELPTRIYPLNDEGIQDGYIVEYGEGGALSVISLRKAGIQEGNAFLFETGELQTHKIFEEGHLIYQGEYENNLKTDNRLFPKFVEEFFFEDKYYAKIRFPFAYKGAVSVLVKGFQAVISPLPNQTFQLVINDALDLNGFELKFTYQPAAQDTLVRSEYTNKHVVYGD